jgi:hypothetical protein
VRLLIVIDPVPPLVSVTTFCPPLPPTGTATQFRLVGVTVALPPELEAPVPVRATVCGLFVAESVKLSVAVRAPVAVGLNTIEAAQVPAAAKLVLHVLLAMVKSAAFVPESNTLEIASEELRPFDKVTVCDALVEPTLVLANVRLVGLTETLPDSGAPYPVSVMV